MNKIKSIIIILILLLSGVLMVLGINAAKTYMSGAAGDCQPKNLKIQAESKSVIISWETDSEKCQGSVKYGDGPAKMTLQVNESEEGSVHRVNILPLKPETSYFFYFQYGDNTYTSSDNLPYTFKTLKDASSPSVTGNMATPTVASSSSTIGEMKSCVQSEFQTRFGTSDNLYDLDKSGEVTTKDWILCLQKFTRK